MNKRYLPVIASIFIVALTATSFLPVMANMAVGLPRFARAVPALRVVTIPEDDEMRKTGIMVLGLGPGKGDGDDLLAQFKVLVSYNGVPVPPTSFYCQVVEKDKYNVIKAKQDFYENFATYARDMTSNFLCKLRWGKPGVGVIDVYFMGSALPQFISDYVLVVGFDLTVGRTILYGTEIQDICVLGWDLGESIETIEKPDETTHYVFQDALGPFVSCEDAALYQKHFVLGLPIPWY